MPTSGGELRATPTRSCSGRRLSYCGIMVCHRSDRLRTAKHASWHDDARSDPMSLSETLHKTRPEKTEVMVGASRCLCCQIQPIPTPDLDPAGTSGRSPRRNVLARDFARDHCVGCGGGDRGGEMLVHG